MNTRVGPGQRRGAQPHPVHLDVVGVAVAAVLVVGGEDIGVLVVEDGGQARRGLVDVGLPEARRVVVGGLARHPRVPVAEVLVARHPEDLAGGGQLDGAALGQGLAGGEEPFGDLAQLAPCGGHQHDPVALGGHAGPSSRRSGSPRRRDGRGRTPRSPLPGQARASADGAELTTVGEGRRPTGAAGQHTSVDSARPVWNVSVLTLLGIQYGDPDESSYAISTATWVEPTAVPTSSSVKFQKAHDVVVTMKLLATADGGKVGERRLLGRRQ